MKVVIDESVFLFLKENRVKLSQQLKTVVNHLKLNPRMYAMIKGIDFGYMIDGEVIIISDCRFVKSNTKLKVR